MDGRTNRWTIGSTDRAHQLVVSVGRREGALKTEGAVLRLLYRVRLIKLVMRPSTNLALSIL